MEDIKTEKQMGSDDESSEDEEVQDDIEKSKQAKRESKRRVKAKYVCNFKVFG